MLGFVDTMRGLPKHKGVMMVKWLRGFVAFAVVCGPAATSHAQEQEPGNRPGGAGMRWIDVHVHVMANDMSTGQELSKQLKVFMEAQNIRSAVVFTPPQSRSSTSVMDGPELMSALADLGHQVVVLGGGATLNPMLLEAADREPSEREKDAFRRRAEVIAKSGARGFGEIALHHLSLTSEHPYESISGDHALMKILMDVAAQYQLVIDLHFDPILAQSTLPEVLRGNRNPENFSPNVDAFERMLAYNRGAKVVWAHAGAGDYFGQYTPELVEGLLVRHPNLYLSIRPGGMRPGAIVGPNAKADAWLEVVKRFPDRFVMGSDSFIVYAGRRGAAQTFTERLGRQAEAIRRTLAMLGPAVARQVGWANAARLYSIPLLP